MKRLGLALLFAFGGYFVAVFAGYWFVSGFSPNHYDRSVEAIMESIFVAGPLGFLVGGIVGFVRGRAARSRFVERRDVVRVHLASGK